MCSMLAQELSILFLIRMPLDVHTFFNYISKLILFCNCIYKVLHKFKDLIGTHLSSRPRRMFRGLAFLVWGWKAQVWSLGFPGQGFGCVKPVLLMCDK